MRIAVPHHTTRALARRKVEDRLGALIGQFGGHAQELNHEWTGDVLKFKGKARGFSLEGSVEVTDDSIVLDAKLPLMAKMFEPKIREAVTREAETMFRTA